MDVQELRQGLWRWASPHPDWEEHGVPREVGSVYYEAPAAVVLIDPLVPVDDEQRFWEALDRDLARVDRPAAVLLTVPWHERSAAEIVDRYGAVRPAEPPAGVSALWIDGVGGEREAIYWLEAPRALVFGDVVLGSPLRVADAWVPDPAAVRHALRPLLDLPVELLLPSHGELVLEDGAEALAQACGVACDAASEGGAAMPRRPGNPEK